MGDEPQVKRSAIAFLCDSVRAEVDERTSVIGLLPSTLTVPPASNALPHGVTVLARVTMFVVIVLPVSEPTTQVKIEAAGDWTGAPNLVAEQPSDQLERGRQDALSKQLPSLTLHATAEFVPFPAVSGGVFRVIVTIDQERILAGQLRFASAS